MIKLFNTIFIIISVSFFGCLVSAIWFSEHWLQFVLTSAVLVVMYVFLTVIDENFNDY